MGRGVAQSGSAPALGAGGPRFESGRPDSAGILRAIDTGEIMENGTVNSRSESARSLMQLYDLRREEKLRDARVWVVRSFNPDSVEDFMAAMQTEDYTYVRMVFGYWDMAASFVVFGAIDREMFTAVSGEMLATYCKVEHMIDELREKINQPGLLLNVQKVVDEWPGSQERMAHLREYLKEIYLS